MRTDVKQKTLKKKSRRPLNATLTTVPECFGTMYDVIERGDFDKVCLKSHCMKNGSLSNGASLCFSKTLSRLFESN